MRKPLNPFGVVALALAVAALLRPAPLAAVDYEFDLTYDPAESVVAGTQVVSFSRSEMADLAGGKVAVLALLNNAGAIPNPHANPLIEDASYQDGFEAGYTRITGIVDAHGAEVPFEALPLAGRRRFTYPIPDLAVRLRLPPRDRYRLTVTFRTRLPALRAGDLTSLDGVFVQRFAWYPRLYPDPDRYTLPPIDRYRVRIVVPPGYRVISHDERSSPVEDGTAYVIESRTPAATIPLTIFPETVSGSSRPHPRARRCACSIAPAVSGRRASSPATPPPPWTTTAGPSGRSTIGASPSSRGYGPAPGAWRPTPS